MKGSRKIVVLLAVICALLTVFSAEGRAAEKLKIEKVEMTSGETAIDETAQWTVTVTGGTAPYTYEYYLQRKPYFRQICFLESGSELTTNSNVYEFPLTAWMFGYYFNVTVSDARGQTASYCSEIYYPKDGIRDRLLEIVALCTSEGMSDDQKAYNLYDWLCLNADYDHTYTWYVPEGVLRYGTGVCDSFSRAYSLLLNEVGIENEIVHGLADYSGENHGWVLVKLDGEWYHMDPTWDEDADRRYYFGLNTELIERDHTSQYLFDVNTLETDYNIPVTTATKYNHEMRKSDGVFSHEDELGALIEALPPEQSEFSFYYTGNSIPMAMQRWYNTNKDEYRLTEYTIITAGGSVFLFNGKRDAQIGDYLISGDGVLTSYVGPGGDVVIPTDTGITSIGEGAFKGHSDVKSIVVPGTVKSVSRGAFVSCASLESIVFEEGVETIESFVVSGCPALTSITLPRSLREVKDGCLFYGLSPTVYCYYGTYAARHADSFGMDYILLDPGYSVRIPFAMSAIEAEAFAGDTMIDGVYVEGYLRTIGSRAFAGCVNMIRINLPGSLYYIAPDAFENCPKLVAYCEADSYALDWCKANGVEYVVE